MPNVIDANGLQTKTRAEIVTALETAFKSIYGNDINLASDTPDGQIIGIFAQVIVDNLDLLTQVYTGFDPDQAIGAVLDQRVGINGIQRQAGTYTITDVDITTDRALNLAGLDQTLVEPFTVSDDQGNEFQLVESQTEASAGTYTYSFRAKNTGAVLTVPNTITQQVTIVVGVTGVNNPNTYTTLGLNEETDAELKIRRAKSVSLSAQGYLQSLLAALENIDGITDAFVYENVTSSTDGDGVPAHSIWVIVSGGTNADIANAIYRKRSAGVGMKGSVTYDVTQADGTLFTIKWDIVSLENLYVRFNASSLDGINPPNTAAIEAQLADKLAFTAYDKININQVATAAQEIDPNTLVTSCEVSNNGSSWSNTVTNTAKNKKYQLLTANIDITVI